MATPPPADPWHYAILGLPPGAPLAECIAAYDRLVAEHDPRRAAPGEQGAAIDLQNALNDAIDAITGAHGPAANLCSDCGQRPAHARGYCPGCYGRRWKRGEFLKPWPETPPRRRCPRYRKRQRPAEVSGEKRYGNVSVTVT